MESSKNRTAALLLAIFLGCFGIHRFYLGKIGTGTVMLLTSFTVVGLWITWIWTLVDIIVIATGGFKDKQGLTVKDWNK